MKIAITGSSGLIGSAFLQTVDSNDVARLVRRMPGGQPNAIGWNPAQGTIEAAKLEGVDAVVNLAGETISKRWTASQKAKIRDSRVQGTRLLSQTLANLRQPPATLVSASAIGFYGDQGSEPLDEQSPPGAGFLPEVCRAWEAATEPAEKAGIRVVRLRFGVVLSTQGGALVKMLTPFRLGLGGRIGSGQQYMSWIALDDVVRVIHFALDNESLRGPVNAVAPESVTNLEFTKTLGRVLRRPTIMPMPALAARLLMGQMADELLLASARVRPVRLTESGFRFDHSELEPALRHLLAQGS